MPNGSNIVRPFTFKTFKVPLPINTNTFIPDTEKTILPSVMDNLINERVVRLFDNLLVALELKQNRCVIMITTDASNL